METPAEARAALGVLIPCRDEAAVIERKLDNLLTQDWPAGASRHRVVVVDDGSRDRTAELARAAVERFAERGITLEVLVNDLRPGKSGALQVGLQHLAGRVQWIVLSDADVVLGDGALLQLVQAFERDARLGMACGSQTFVASLCADGSLRAADGQALRPAQGLYDRLTALVRRLESLGGRLFSVHGQLLAWRADLDLEPTPRMAADDLDLMLQARLRGARIERVGAARFFEVKTPAGSARDDQALRRARAYLQFLGHPRMGELARAGSSLARLQVTLYRRAPSAAPWAVPLLFGGLALLLAVLMLQLGGAAALGALALVVLVLHTSVGHRLTDLLDVIRRAKRAEAGVPLSDHWETPRA